MAQRTESTDIQDPNEDQLHNMLVHSHIWVLILMVPYNSYQICYDNHKKSYDIDPNRTIVQRRTYQNYDSLAQSIPVPLGSTEHNINGASEVMRGERQKRREVRIPHVQ
jgi:hypothetical protein